MDDLTLNAQDLTNPNQPIAVPQPDPVETPAEFVQRSGIIQANTAESQQRDQVFDQIQEVGQDRKSFDTEFNDQLRSFGTPDAVKGLRDAQEELARLNTGFDLDNSRIEDGNSIRQSGREVTQNERERAIRTAGTAARVQLLQGNIETAQSIARDTVNFAFQDEQARLNQLGRQYDALDGRVEGQEEQLLEQRRNELEAEKAELDNLRDNVQKAISSGAATAAEMATLTDSNRSQEDRVALAQEIAARGASEDRALDQSAKRASIANAYSQIADRERVEAGNQYNTRNGKEQSSTEIQAQGYAERMGSAHRVISDIGGDFTSRFAIGGILPNEVQTGERQQYEQAKRNFVNSVLRRESGAAIAESEFESADRQYFPQAGDSEAVIAQKAANRESVINNMYQQANIFRPVLPGDVIESDGVTYEVAEDGQTLIEQE